jgi:pimeloyl-ACP methyl ester carboxylesterase
MANILTRAALGRQSFIEVEKNVRLHITDQGEGDPIILIHGLPFSNIMFEYQYQYLVKTGYRTVGISLRGFGLSDKPYGTYNYDVFADDIKIILETLEIDNAVLCGFSTGAAAAIRYTVRYNGAHINKLALFSAAAPFLADRNDASGPLKKHAEEFIRLINSDRPEFFKVFTRLSAGRNQFAAANITQLLSISHEWVSSYAIEQCLILLRDADLMYDLKKINVYTAIFHGKNDQLFPFDIAEQLYALIPRSYFVPFEESGHVMFLEEMEKFNSTLLRFIRLANIRRPQPVEMY